MKVALLNSKRLNFDGKLSFLPIKEVVEELICFDETELHQVNKNSEACEAIISKEMYIDDKTIMSLPAEVRLICEAGTGTNNIDLIAAENRGIKVCNVPNYSTPHVAQLTMNFIISLSSGLYLPRQIRSEIQPNSENSQLSNISEIQGKILGVIGAGAIGKEVIRLAHAFNMSILVSTAHPHEWHDKLIKQISLPELLANSDFITLHCPLNESTYHLIDNNTIQLMKQGAFIINTSRGGLINHNDLIKALQSGNIAGAALDVQEPEPLPDDHILRTMHNVIITDHIGWKAIECRERLVEELAKNIKYYIKTGIPINQVGITTSKQLTLSIALRKIRIATFWLLRKFSSYWL